MLVHYPDSIQLQLYIIEILYNCNSYRFPKLLCFPCILFVNKLSWITWINFTDSKFLVSLSLGRIVNTDDDLTLLTPPLITALLFYLIMICDKINPGWADCTYYQHSWKTRQYLNFASLSCMPCGLYIYTPHDLGSNTWLSSPNHMAMRTCLTTYPFRPWSSIKLVFFKCWAKHPAKGHISVCKGLNSTRVEIWLMGADAWCL